MKNEFNQFICGRRSLKDEVREGPAKTDVVPENIDDVHELNSDYREIKAFLEISSISIHFHWIV